MSDSQILIEDVGPNGNIEALVEDDGRTTYLYWNPAPELGQTMRAVWLRNAGAAPAEFDSEGMKDGLAPQMPQKFCRFPLGGQPALRAEELRFSWTEDGSGLFLLEGDELLAAIPSWTSLTEGFSRDVKADSPVALALNDERLADVKSRLERAEEFWKRWSDARAAWPSVGDPQLQVLEAALGKPMALDQLSKGWPRKLLASYATDDANVAITIGVGLRPQPKIDADAGALAPKLRRIELGLAIDPSTPAEDAQRLGRFLAEQSDYPWARLSWLGNGHSIGCDVIPPAGETKFEAVLWLSAPAGAPRIALPSIDGEPVNLLWMVPITEGERAFARKNGSAKLVERLVAAGAGWIHKPRREADLG